MFNMKCNVSDKNRPPTHIYCLHYGLCPVNEYYNGHYIKLELILDGYISANKRFILHS